MRVRDNSESKNNEMKLEKKLVLTKKKRKNKKKSYLLRVRDNSDYKKIKLKNK